MPETFTAYITKHASTRGIVQTEAKVSLVSPEMICVDGRPPVYYHGEEWHTDLDAARKRAEAMRKAKLAELRRKIAKLEAMSF